MKKKPTEAKPQLRGAPLLAADEQIIAVERPSRMLPRYLATLGLYEMWRKRQLSAVTDRRLLLGRGVIRRDEKAIPLRRVQDVSFTRRGIASYASAVVRGHRGSETVTIGPLSAQRARGSTARLSDIFLETLRKHARRFRRSRRSTVAARCSLSLVPPTRRSPWAHPGSRVVQSVSSLVRP